MLLKCSPHINIKDTITHSDLHRAKLRNGLSLRVCGWGGGEGVGGEWGGESAKGDCLCVFFLCFFMSVLFFVVVVFLPGCGAWGRGGGGGGGGSL